MKEKKNKAAQLLAKESHRKQKEKYGDKYSEEMRRRVNMRYTKGLTV